MVKQVNLVTVVGARPQFIKAAAVSRAVETANAKPSGIRVRETLVHTGQHYDPEMSGVFFEELDLPPPRENLGIRAATISLQTGDMIKALSTLLPDLRPDVIVVHGDTTSTLSASIAAAQSGIPLAHVEAGLRSHDRSMPEELNRRLSDHAADVLFTPTNAATKNLHDEGISPSSIVQVGDVMYDSFIYYSTQVVPGATFDSNSRPVVLATFHRAANTDDQDRAAGICESLVRLADEHSVLFPVHPRTEKAIRAVGWWDRLAASVKLGPPVGYRDMIRSLTQADVVVTDSGGLQKEAYFAGKPCVILRDDTEWVELLDVGASILSGVDPRSVVDAVRHQVGASVDSQPIFGNGTAADQIVRSLADFLR